MKIKYNIVYSRRRSIGIIVSPDKGVVVRAPYRASLKTIDRFVREKADWIRKHTERFSGITQLNHDKLYTDGEIHLYMGREHILKISPSSQSYVNQYDNIIEVGSDGKEGRVKMLLDRWYMKKAEEKFSAKLKEILIRYKEYNFSPSKLAVRSLKSRWGSCTSKGKITISSELAKLEERLIDYVIIHELCHLKYHNHGKGYYHLLEMLVPDYKAIRKELRKYITK